jgi:hypothetical protein
MVIGAWPERALSVMAVVSVLLAGAVGYRRRRRSGAGPRDDTRTA